MRAIWIVPIIVSILILGTLGLSQDVFATHNAHVVVTPDRQSGLVNQLQTFSVEFKSDGKIREIGGVPDSTLTISCDPPIQTNFPSKVVRFVPQDFTVKSGTPGIFICEAEVKGQGRSTGDNRFRPYAVSFTFVPVFNSLAPDTTITEVKDFTKDILLQSGDSVLTQGTLAQVQFSFTGTDDIGVQSISCKGLGASNFIIRDCISPQKFNLPLGESTIRIQAFDGLNLDPTPAEFKVTVLKDTDGDGIADNDDPSPGIVSKTFKFGTGPSFNLGSILSGNTNSFSGYSSSFNPKIPEYCKTLSDAIKEKFTTCKTSTSFKFQTSFKPSTPKPSFSFPSLSLSNVKCSGFGCSWSTGSGSSIVQVDNGIAEVEFEATDGRLATATIEAGNTIIFDPDAFTFEGALDNTSPVDVIADGLPLVVFPGANLNQVVADLQADLATAQAALATAQADLATTLTELGAALDDLNAAQANLEAAEAEITALEDTIAEGTVFSSDVADNITVGPGQIFTIKSGAIVSGNVFVNGGTLNLIERSTVTGNVETTQAGSTINIQLSSVDGDVLATDAQSVTIIDSSVNGNIIIENAAACTESNNTVNGNNSGCP